MPRKRRSRLTSKKGLDCKGYRTQRVPPIAYTFYRLSKQMPEYHPPNNIRQNTEGQNNVPPVKETQGPTETEDTDGIPEESIQRDWNELCDTEVTEMVDLNDEFKTIPTRHWADIYVRSESDVEDNQINSKAKKRKKKDVKSIRHVN